MKRVHLLFCRTPLLQTLAKVSYGVIPVSLTVLLACTNEQDTFLCGDFFKLVFNVRLLVEPDRNHGNASLVLKRLDFG